QPDAVKHEPSGLLGDAQSAGKLARTDSVFGVHNHPESGKPFIKAKGAVLKNRSGLDGKLFAAIAALPNFARGKESRLGGIAARAGRVAVGPANRNHELQRPVSVRKVFDCACQCFGELVVVFHTPNIAQSLW
ncbi:MAG: hypothetical protein WBN75_12205, partial [Verrucomicrobiia bacterium]